MSDTPKRKRKTVEQRFDDWWERNGYGRHYGADIVMQSVIKTYARMGYANGWAARTRTKR